MLNLVQGKRSRLVEWNVEGLNQKNISARITSPLEILKKVW
jgi:hypothetical protein